MANVTEIFESLRRRFNKDAAATLDIVFQFDVTDGKPYHLTVKGGNLGIFEGAHSNPSVTLIADKNTMAAIINGSIDGTQAFMQGKLKAEGDVMLATKLKDLFSI